MQEELAHLKGQSEQGTLPSRYSSIEPAFMAVWDFTRRQTSPEKDPRKYENLKCEKIASQIIGAKMNLLKLFLFN